MLFTRFGSARLAGFRLTIGAGGLVIAGWFLFNHLLVMQDRVMYKYFIERPTQYNLKRAEGMATAIHRSFLREVSDLAPENITRFLAPYNRIPFLKVNCILIRDDGQQQTLIRTDKTLDPLTAEYAYPLKHAGGGLAGYLLIYDINKEYEEGMQEYRHIMNVTRYFFMGFLLLLFCLLLYQEYTYKITQEKKIAEYDACHDGLTGLYTHKYFVQVFADEIERARRYRRPLSLLIADLDHFKLVNDEYGHLTGDRVLMKVARVISFNVRTSDVVCRYGGEEFAVLLPETGVEGAQILSRRIQGAHNELVVVADRIRQGIGKTTVPVDGAQQVGVTVSIGIASFDGGQEPCSPEKLIQQADRALYESKHAGRNRIMFFDQGTGHIIPVKG